MSPSLARVLVLASVVLPLAGCAPHPAADGPEPNPAVLAALRDRGHADVVVSLHPPEGYAGAGAAEEGSAVREEIARLQQTVLDALDPADFRLRRRYTAVPALAGTVLTEAGLRTLAAHPAVAAVDLDVGGGGGTP